MTLLVLVLAALAVSSDALLPTRSAWVSGLQSRSVVLNAQKNIAMPALSSTMKEGKIIAWNKQVGDKVSAGEVLLVVESDKADMDVEAFEDGYLAAIHTPEGGIAVVGAAVATLVDEASEIGSVGSAPSAAAAPAAASPVAAAAAATAAAAPASTGPAPAFNQILMPALSSTMKEGKIVAWNKQVGDKISSGDMVLVVESDKADMDVESYEEGYLAAVLVKEGEVAAVGKPVCYLAATPDEIDGVAAFARNGGAPAQAPAPAANSAVPVPAAATTATTPAKASAPAVVNSGHVAASGYAKAVAQEQGIDLRTVTPSRPDHYITSQDLATGSVAAFSMDGILNVAPTARKLAKEHGVDLSKLVGSGSFGRVTGDDVLRAAGKLPAAAAAAPTTATASAVAAAAVPKAKAAASVSPAGKAAAPEGVVPMDGMQRAVAKNMEKTLAVPIFHVTREIVTDRLDALYAKLKPKGVTMSALIAKAVAVVVQQHPLLNAAYVDGGIQYHSDVNVAMAVAIDGGLITPTIHKAQSLDLFSIGRVWKELVDKAKAKKLSPAEYSAGTFTISNLGMFGVAQFDAILPHGMGSILAISASLPKVVQQQNGHFGVQHAMQVTLTCDHRHIYGAHAAEFLRDLADLLENHVEDLLLG